MSGLSESEILLYAGLAIMAAALILTVGCVVVYTVTGRRLKRKLNREYGVLHN
ncbi:MAG: hypothetical protein LUG83_07210 [Lachnospiraceae bacterium]|nr:hypothetical protein [Lachnospiraceae bacterium]